MTLLISKGGLIGIAVAIVIALIAIFFISYVWNKKTPVPKGCENILISEENCAGCNNTDCKLRKEKKEKVEDSEEKPAELDSNSKKSEDSDDTEVK